MTAIKSNEKDEINFLEIMGVLIDHKWLIGGITGAFIAAGAAYAILATPIYQANALIQVEAKKSDMSGFSDLNTMLGKESPSVTEIEIIKSRSIIGRTVDNLNLDVVIQPNYLPVFGEFIARRYTPIKKEDVAAPWLGLSNFAWGGEFVKISKLNLPKSLLGVQLVLVVGENGEYRIFDGEGISIVDGHVGELYSNSGIEIKLEEIRANVGTKFYIVRKSRLDAILDYQGGLNVSERGKESGIISLSLDSKRPALAINILNEIAGLYVRQNIDRTSAEAAQSLEFLNSQLPQVRSDLEKAETALNQYQTRSKSVDISLETKAILDQIVALDTAISQLKLQQVELDRRFTPEHPAYRVLLSQLGELKGRQNGLARKVENLPTTQQELLSLTRDVKVGTEIYTQLLNRSQELDVMRAGTIGNVRLIDSADSNLNNPIGLKKSVILILAALLGAFIAIVFVLFRKALNRGVESPEAIETLGLPVYASIPYSALQSADEIREGKSSSGVDKANSKMSLLTVNHPTDLAVEALRSLRTSLHFAMLEARDNRLMISGPIPEVGKTFVSSNLAAVIAQAGQRVLLIDADMRRGYLHKVLGVSPENGLSDLLIKRCELTSAIHRTDIEGFDFIARGQIPPNPSELLMHVNFSEFLESVSGLYDLVIIDTPPLLAVTDAAIVGRQSSTNLIVTRFGMNSVKEIEAVMHRFSQNGIELKGAVFNGVQRRASGTYGYRDYGYYHYDYKSDRA